MEEPPSFIPEGDQESSSEPKTESHPVLKVKLPFHRMAKKAPKTLDEESAVPKKAPSKSEQEVVTISDGDRTSEETSGPSTSQSTEVSSQKWRLEGQGSVLESSTPKKQATKEETAVSKGWSLPSKIKEADLHPIRYETYCEDYEVVH